MKPAAQCNHLRRNSWLDCEFLRTRVYTPTSGLNFGQVYRPPNRNWARVNSENVVAKYPARGLRGVWVVAAPYCAENRGNSCQRKHPAEIVALGPSCDSHPRLVSAAGIRLNHRKSVRPFKGIFCDDISEFESSHPSHAVGSLWRVYPVHGLCEQRRSL
jgi:hypothetical protein